ncbi:MAG: hypothetical protein Q8P05_05395 [Candidatus Diapherotrites archaeon]|nr:hypothetical protein [Candidatus Diapherotrites archaeon]
MTTPGQLLAEANKGFILAVAEQRRKSIAIEKARLVRMKNNEKEITVPCAYPYYDYKNSVGIAQKVQVDCEMGKGIWCEYCIHFKRHHAQNNPGKKGYEAARERKDRIMQETGLSPIARRRGVKIGHVTPAQIDDHIAQAQEDVKRMAQREKKEQRIVRREY